MINYGKVRSTTQPPEIKTTATKVFIASNIVPYTETIDNYTTEGYEYDYVSYSKDEYIQLLTENNAQAIAALEEELHAAKIILGVE